MIPAMGPAAWRDMCLPPFITISGGISQVRGAYIVIENERAAAQGYPSPIHDCIEDTHANYSRCAAALLLTLRLPDASARARREGSKPSRLCSASLS